MLPGAGCCAQMGFVLWPRRLRPCHNRRRLFLHIRAARYIQVIITTEFGMFRPVMQIFERNVRLGLEFDILRPVICRY